MMGSLYICSILIQMTCPQSIRAILTSNHPQLTADNVGVHMALEVFELRRAFEWDEWKLKDEQLFDVPDHLSEALRSLVLPFI